MATLGHREERVDLSARLGRAGLVLALLAVAAALRFASIESKSLWFDEAYSARVASLTPRALVAFVAADDTHPPLYYLLLSGWVRLFGAGEAALRSLGALLSVATVGVTVWVGNRVGAWSVGVLAGFLVAVAPLQILAAQEARMYPLLGLLTACSWGALLAAVDGHRRAWVAYVAASVLALYTHSFAFLTLLGQGVFVLAAARQARQPWLVSQLVVLLCFVPWAGVLLDTVGSGRAWPFFRPPVGLSTMTGLAGLMSFGGHALGFEGYFGGATAPAGRQALVLLPVVLLLVAAAASLWKRSQAAFLSLGYLVIPVMAAFLLSWRYNIFYGRYFSFVQPAFALLMACGLMAVTRVLPHPSRRAGLLVLVLIGVAANAFVLNEIYSNPRYSLFNWRGAAALLSRHAGPDDLIVTFPGLAQVPLSYYFKGPQRIEPMTPQELHGRFQATVTPDPALAARNRDILRTYAAEHRVMWIVATAPMPPAAVERLQQLLVGIYEREAVADFNAIEVWKYRRTPGWAESR